MKGKKHSPESINKMINAKLGHKVSNETKEKMRLAKLGKKLSEEHKRKIGLTSKGKKRPKFSKEWLENMSLSQKGRKVSEETREKLRISSTGRKFPFKKHKPHSEETKKKIGDAQRGRILPRRELHFNWKGGKTEESSLIRASSEYKVWRKSVFERDNYECKKCNQIGGKLEVHHIINFAQNKDLRININNGITFCKHCHNEFHKKYGIKNNNEKQLKEYLMNN